MTTPAEAERILGEARETGIGRDGLPIGAGALFEDLHRVSQDILHRALRDMENSSVVAELGVVLWWGWQEMEARSPPGGDDAFVTPQSGDRGAREGGLSEAALGEAGD